MGLFKYSAIDSQGKTVSDVVEASTVAVAQEILDRRGLIPTDISESSSVAKKKGGSSLFQKKVKAVDLILFTRQFEVMVRAGVPMVRIMKTLQEQCENKRLKSVVGQISKDIEEGVELSAAVSKHKAVFSNLYGSMLKAGESSGALEKILARLTYIIEHEDKIKKDITSAMVYPITVIGFLIGAFVIVLVFVMPKFVGMFKKANISLPWQTQLCIDLSTILTTHWVTILAVLFGIIIAIYSYVRTEKGKYTRDYILLKLPLIGNVLTKSIMSRFASVFAILISSGVPILGSLTILRDTLSNYVMAKAFETISERLRQGEGIAEPLKQSGLFPPLMCNIVAIGEETGQLDELLQDISKHYDIEVDLAMKKVVDAIPTILTVGLAIVVGFFAMAIYLPMFEIITSAH